MDHNCSNCSVDKNEYDAHTCRSCDDFCSNWTSIKQDNINSPEPEIDCLISLVCSDVGQFLIRKNKAYGSSVIEPVRIFSKAGTEEQFNVRIDDKLSRIMKGKEYADEDTELDLIGYLIMKRVYRKWRNEP